MRSLVLSAAFLGAMTANTLAQLYPAGVEHAHPAGSALVAAAPVASASDADSVADTTPRIVRAGLPAPSVPADAKPSDFLMAARIAVIAGRLAEAQEALEEAQTRLLDRSVPLFQTNEPSPDPAVGRVAAARHALDAGDRAACVQAIQEAITVTAAEGL